MTMKRAAAAALILAVTADAQPKTNPLNKVIGLLKEFSEKVKKDGNAANVANAKQMQLCTTSQAEKNRFIADGKSTIEALGAKIAKATSDADIAAERIEELQSSLSNSAADADNAAAIRKKEGEEASKAIGQLVDTVDMLGRAANLLKDRLSTGALLQKQIDTMSDDGIVDALHKVMDAAAFPTVKKEALLALAGTARSRQAPVKKAYDVRSNGIIDVLMEMKQEARQNLEQMRTEERSQQHSYDLLKASLDDQMKSTKNQIEENQGAQGQANGEKGAAQSDLNVATSTMKEDQKSLEELVSSCKQAADDFAKETATRTDELAALAKATEVLIESTGNAEKQMYQSPAFVQLSSIVHHIQNHDDLVNEEVVDMIRHLGEQTKSTGLTQLAGQIESVMSQPAAANDPFAKVKELINQMIEKLREESRKDQKHEEYCLSEQQQSKEKIKKLTNSKERYQSSKDTKTAQREALKTRVAATNEEITALLKEQAQMDVIRTEEKKVYETYHADLTQGLDGVRAATKVLHDFYETKNSALLQVNGAKKAKSKKEGIFEMLEVVDSDISRSLVEAQTQEDSRQEDYTTISKDNSIEKSTKESEVKYKLMAVAALDKSLSNVVSDQESNKAELDAAMEYKKSLDEQCSNKKESYEDMKARQEKQLAGLKEAVEVLRSGAVFLQKTNHLRGEVGKHLQK
eukprot:TRINITY_DN82012_c0_g1_i1.p1 TRINITY_DN82012_c0_g1~~TRINITY_DN82012_c0_g1_i1.p1  ORF type:complete len:690 (+),score=252.26 TRINITY_DN82012_c0_g1_i1:88-2157(+)